MQGKVSSNPHAGNYQNYFQLAKSGIEEPATTHSDHYMTNFAYSRAAYYKGCVFLNQLGYVIGRQNLDEGLLRYYYDLALQTSQSQ